MRSTSAFHPELRRAAALLPRRALGPRSFRIVRALSRLTALRSSDDVEIHRLGDISVRLHRPASGPGPHPALLWMHGGGYIIGNAAQDDHTCRRIARDLGAVVAAVDYRLAPEHPFPTPLHDCHDALEWLATRDDVDEDRIAVAGASAGGGLAAGLALLARERAVVHPVAQILLYPMLDDRTAVCRDLDDLPVRLWDNRANRFAWAAYTGVEPGSPSVSPLAAPARHQDLTGLPPAWIGVGTADLFHTENVAYAEGLRSAGVACTLHEVAGGFHAFDICKAPVVDAFLEARDVAVADAFRRRPRH